jgi:archaellum component FlaF (FlaF/FlaG flagellin family)
LFGDAVNTASRIESSSEAQMIHISEMTKAMLNLSEWNVLERGTVELKGKGFMKTYYLLSRRMNGVEEDNVTASLAPLKLMKKNNSAKAVLRHELKRALKIANRDDKPVTKYTMPSVSVDESYETKLNQMMQMQLSKEISLTDVYNTKNTNITDQNYINSKNSLIDIENQQLQQMHQIQQLQQQTGIDKSGTNKIIINNSFLGNEKIPDAIINTTDNALENNDGENGCFSCNKKLKSSNGCSIL